VPSTTPADLAAGIRSVLVRMAADPGWRARIRALARERHAWPVAEAAYVELVRGLRSQ
jgi:hypothetical protein